MRVFVPIFIGIVSIMAACGLDETGQSSPQTGGQTGNGGGGVSDAPFGGGPSTGGIGGAKIDASFGGSGGVGGTADSAAGGGSAGNPSAGSGGVASGGTVGVDCSPYPNAKGFVLPTGQSHCYWMNPTALGFPEARIACQAQSGNLATIHSAEENEFVRQLASPVKYPTEEVWIGGSDGNEGDDDSTDSYEWVTDESWDYENWEPGEPNYLCQDCGGNDCKCEHRMALDVAGGGWNDLWAVIKLRSVCEAGQLLP